MSTIGCRFFWKKSSIKPPGANIWAKSSAVTSLLELRETDSGPLNAVRQNCPTVASRLALTLLLTTPLICKELLVERSVNMLRIGSGRRAASARIFVTTSVGGGAVPPVKAALAALSA